MVSNWLSCRHLQYPRRRTPIRLGWSSLRERHHLLNEIRGPEIGSLQCESGEDGQETDLSQNIAGPPDQDPLTLCFAGERKLRLEQAFARLPEREQQVLMLYYQQELTMHQVGARRSANPGSHRSKRWRSNICAPSCGAVIHSCTKKLTPGDDFARRRLMERHPAAPPVKSGSVTMAGDRSIARSPSRRAWRSRWINR